MTANATDNFTVEFAVNEQHGKPVVAVSFSGKSWNRTLTFGTNECQVFLREMYKAYKAAWELEEQKKQPAIFIPTTKMPRNFGGN